MNDSLIEQLRKKDIVSENDNQNQTITLTGDAKQTQQGNKIKIDNQTYDNSSDSHNNDSSSESD